MPLPAWVLLSFALWLAAEGAAFALIVHLVGFVGAIGLCILTSLAGITLLHRLGLAAALHLRRSLTMKDTDRTSLSRQAVVDGALSAIGSILLILPGFVSDFAGLALAAPSIRGWVANRLPLGKDGRRPRERGAAPEIVELAPQEWSRLDDRAPHTRQSAP